MSASISIQAAADFLRDHDGYLILTHLRPDGDTVGCAAALCDRAVWIENGTVRHAGGKEQISAFFRLDAQCKG